MPKTERLLSGALLLLLAGTALPLRAQMTIPPLSDEDKARIFAHREPPPDVAAVPEDAKRTASGLAYRVLQAGSGEVKPQPNDLVTVHFAGWTSSGVLLESTRHRNQPRLLQVNRAAPGIAEALQMMKEGGSMRVWIPPSLAEFKGRVPEEMLVYDVELLKIRQAPPTPPDLNAVPADALQAGSGWGYKVLRKGIGEQHPGPEDQVLAHYTLWTRDGEIVVSTVRAQAPDTVELSELSPGPREVLEQMVVGEKRRVWMPAQLDELENGDRVWEIELLAIFTRPTAPPDVTSIPEDATRTRSGLAYKVLRQGTGKRHPQVDEEVVINYATWTADGELVDSSYERGMPVGLTLGDKLPPAWNEAIQMMVEGEKRRIWMPEGLGFEGKQTPKGMLVFEVDLVSIE